MDVAEINEKLRPVRQRLSVLDWAWYGPIGLTLFAFALRIWNLSQPKELTFDETYYAKDAWGLIHWGYVRDATKDANDRIMRGETDVFTKDPAWIVHPDGGKWLIGIGEWMFGLTPFGWRFSAVVVGSLMVLVLSRLIIRLTGSTLIGCIGGLLLALDGLHFTMSRIALLDIFLAFWILCGVACLAVDRDQLTDRLKAGGAYVKWRPWQLGAGICFGMACATKWSGVYVLAAFGVTIVAWELWARYEAGLLGQWRDWPRAVLSVGLPAFGWLVVVALIVYTLTWTGWLIHHQTFENRFGRGYGEGNPPWGSYVDKPTSGPFGGVIDAFRSWVHFHGMTYRFHTSDYMGKQTHPYQSNPFGWLLQTRPTNVASNFEMDPSLCGAAPDSKCVSQVLTVGNPAVWWVGSAALFTALIAFIRKPTWRWSLPLVGVAATWFPWIQNWLSEGRPIFTFYAVTILPFVIIATCLVLNALRRRLPERLWAISVGVYLLVVVALFVWFFPIWTNQVIPLERWESIIWFNHWI